MLLAEFCFSCPGPWECVARRLLSKETTSGNRKPCNFHVPPCRFFYFFLTFICLPFSYSATKFGTTMLVTALSITIGLSLAHALSRPLRHPKIWRTVRGVGGPIPICLIAPYSSLNFRSLRCSIFLVRFSLYNLSHPSRALSLTHTHLLTNTHTRDYLHVPPRPPDTGFRWFMTPVVKLGNIAGSVSRVVSGRTTHTLLPFASAMW